jgi:uncharacterized membrane-anchored protein YitT (DUF2179 family)
MIEYYKKFVRSLYRKYLKKDKNDNVSDYLVAKEAIKFKVSAISFIKDICVITIGIISAGFGLESFLLPIGFIDGGVTGISLLVNAKTGFELAYLIVLINIPFIILGYFQVGIAFAFKSILAILGLALAITFIHYPIITSDKLLIAVFGGFFLGAGIGLSIRGGSVLDGTEVLAIYLSKKTGLTIGDLILVFNIVIFSAAAFLLNYEVAMYSILTYLSASKTVDFIIEGVEEYIGVAITSSHSEEIRMMVIETMARGVTVYKGTRGFGKKEDLCEIDIIYTVITRLEISKLQTEIQKIDPNAFTVMNSVKDIKGGMIKKRKFKD